MPCPLSLQMFGRINKFMDSSKHFNPNSSLNLTGGAPGRSLLQDSHLGSTGRSGPGRRTRECSFSHSSIPPNDDCSGWEGAVVQQSASSSSTTTSTSHSSCCLVVLVVDCLCTYIPIYVCISQGPCVCVSEIHRPRPTPPFPQPTLRGPPLQRAAGMDDAAETPPPQVSVTCTCHHPLPCCPSPPCPRRLLHHHPRPPPCCLDSGALEEPHPRPHNGANDPPQQRQQRRKPPPARPLWGTGTAGEGRSRSWRRGTGTGTETGTSTLLPV